MAAGFPFTAVSLQNALGTNWHGNCIAPEREIIFPYLDARGQVTSRQRLLFRFVGIQSRNSTLWHMADYSTPLVIYIVKSFTPTGLPERTIYLGKETWHGRVREWMEITVLALLKGLKGRCEFPPVRYLKSLIISTYQTFWGFFWRIPLSL